MWLLWIILGLALSAAAFIFIVSWHLVSLVITPKRTSIEDIEKQEIERGNLKEGELKTLVPSEEGCITANDGVRIDYCWYRAAGPTNRVCVCAHGFWVRREVELKYARIYNQRGYDVLLFHQRNSGTSEGRLCTMGYLERYDLKALVELARKDKGYPEKTCIVGVQGDSLGGATVLLTSCLDDPPDFAVADCPFATLRDQLMYNLHSMKHLPAWPFERPAERILKLRAGFGYNDVSPLNELKGKNGLEDVPVLFIHGTADKLIPYTSTLRLYDAKRGKKALYICPNAAHVRSISTDREKYYAVVNAFLDKYGF